MGRKKKKTVKPWCWYPFTRFLCHACMVWWALNRIFVLSLTASWQVLQPWIRRWKSTHFSPESQAFQMSHLPQEALHCPWPCYPLLTGTYYTRSSQYGQSILKHLVCNPHSSQFVNEPLGSLLMLCGGQSWLSECVNESVRDRRLSSLIPIQDEALALVRQSLDLEAYRIHSRCVKN